MALDGAEIVSRDALLSLIRLDHPGYRGNAVGPDLAGPGTQIRDHYPLIEEHHDSPGDEKGRLHRSANLTYFRACRAASRSAAW